MGSEVGQGQRELVGGAVLRRRGEEGHALCAEALGQGGVLRGREHPAPVEGGGPGGQAACARQGALKLALDQGVVVEQTDGQTERLGGIDLVLVVRVGCGGRERVGADQETRDHGTRTSLPVVWRCSRACRAAAPSARDQVAGASGTKTPAAIRARTSSNSAANRSGRRVISTVRW